MSASPVSDRALSGSQFFTWIWSCVSLFAGAFYLLARPLTGGSRALGKPVKQHKKERRVQHRGHGRKARRQRTAGESQGSSSKHGGSDSRYFHSYECRGS